MNQNFKLEWSFLFRDFSNSCPLFIYNYFGQKTSSQTSQISSDLILVRQRTYDTNRLKYWVCADCLLKLNFCNVHQNFSLTWYFFVDSQCYVTGCTWIARERYEMWYTWVVRARYTITISSHGIFWQRQFYMVHVIRSRSRYAQSVSSTLLTISRRLTACLDFHIPSL